MRIKNILVPVDFSEASRKAVVYAISLAKKFDSKIVFLHGYQVVFDTFERPSMAPAMDYPVGTGLSEKELSRETLMDFLQAFPQLDEIEHEDVVGLGSAVNVIRHTAENENTDLIVMATAGAAGAKGFFIGTNSEKVSRKAPCPVLIVPDELESYEIGTVCLALDTDNPENTVDMEVLVALLTGFGAKLRIIHISGNGETAFKREELMAHYKRSLGKIEHSFHVFYAENPAEGLKEFLDTNPIELMALLYRKHGFFERLLQPGTRKKMVFKTEVPLLILK